ncbi:E3 ubiquitin-protein ligase MYCBP2-like isoform X3 [Lineus longissimus]|uniref:E3 ubiquitin-protein ligase MYCBP2-like isoform X3 n=1 Tax=Lineus longissimus TaxID=88925 RepID=UPI00315C6391
MAAAAVMENSRCHVAQFLQGQHLAGKFHELFTEQDESNRKKSDKKKPIKKRAKANKGKDKGKQAKRDKSPEPVETAPPYLELHGNPSAFNVFCTIRQCVLDHQARDSIRAFAAAHGTGISEGESDEEEDKMKESMLKMPKIVGLGLCGVFELIKETKMSHASLCTRALQALLDMLQGQMPEGMKCEPGEVVDSLYYLLMDLTTKPNPDTSIGCYSLNAVACACLISLVIARGETGKLLSAVAAMLMSPAALASQDVKVPGILTSLQRSVQSVLLGRTAHPDWLNNGIPQKAQTETIKLADSRPNKSGSYKVSTKSAADGGFLHSAIATDGKYLYLHTREGLQKIGSGYNSTIKGHIYMSRPDFHPRQKGWLAFAKGMLFFKDTESSSSSLSVINTDTLEEEKHYLFEGNNIGSNILFSDGDYIGRLAATKDDSFVVRTYNPVCSPMPIVNEIPLKLARKCLDTFGSSTFDPLTDMRTICTNHEEEAVAIAAGKEFALIKTTSGKILFTGKAQVLGIKHGGPAAGKWAELSITKSPKIVQFSIGHEGMHALLVADDGSVFFTGTPKRGEDGDSGIVEGRRALKPTKPKKMIKLESKVITSSSCNYGTSAVVTKDGEVFMFGKDTMHCDHASGHVTDLKDVAVMTITLGKAHAVALTNDGQIYTFGLNNKGQCGRDVSLGASKEASNNVTMADEEEDIEVDDLICAPGAHKWKNHECMICTLCGECTGYGNSCVNSGMPARNPGQPCGCGSGESGCSECGCCKTCAGEPQDPEKGDIGILEAITKNKDDIPFDLLVGKQITLDVKEIRAKSRSCVQPRDSGILGRIGARNLDQLTRKIEEKRQKLKAKAVARQQKVVKGMAQASGGEGSSDHEQDHAKTVSLPPAQVVVGTGERPVVQVSCGLHHTVLLLDNGDVYTFGSNQYGQLGLGDTTTRGTPTLVPLNTKVVQVVAGSSHTVVLTSSGMIYTFGAYQKSQLGRPGPDENQAKDKKRLWYATPAPVPGIGAKFGRRATWIGASGDQTFLRIDESLINAHTLSRSNIFSNQTCIGLIPMGDDSPMMIRCLIISKQDGTCKSFSSHDQADLSNQSVCLDPFFDVLWSYNPKKRHILCYNLLRCEVREARPSIDQIVSPELAVPCKPGTITSRSNCALYLLGCLDTLTTANRMGVTVIEEDREKALASKTYSKEDFSVVNRFKSHGGGWGYSDHSVEAIRFSADSDILLGGFGLFGGRGLYFGKIKLFDLGPDGGENESFGDLLAETEEIPFECGAREKYPILFDEPIPLQANSWYCSWARVSGPSSDCGSSGQYSIVTEDQVVFKFKSSKKSNNGTDVNAGQIPQILYRLPTHESGLNSRKYYPQEFVHILSKDFSKTVSPDCFESLLKLLHWSWNTFNAVLMEMDQLQGTNMTAALLDLERLVYITMATLRLISTFICEVYPIGASKKSPQETGKLAEAVGETRMLLRRILSENRPKMLIRKSTNHGAPLPRYLQLPDQILEECHRTFVACFHAFYPTGTLKWICLCDLLNFMDPSYHDVEGFGRLLAAVMEALCHPTVKLTSVLPINCEHETELLLKQQYKVDDNEADSPQSGDLSCFPLLVSHMTHRTEIEGIGTTHFSFKEVLDKLMSIIVLPVRQAMKQEHVIYPSRLVSNTCSLLAAVISELTSSATGHEVDTTHSTTRPLYTTPNRFTRMSQSAYWNPGNGSPDSVCFSVDRQGIVIAGVGVYGGGPHYDYELELLDEITQLNQNENGADPSHTQRWNSIEIVKGSYGGDDCVNNIAELKFERPIPIKETTKYAIRLRNHGSRTYNGDGGMAKVKCADGTTFSFSACSLSSNGTNHTRGQIPHVLYYSAPQEGENRAQSSKLLAEYQARKNAITLVSTMVRTSADLLHRAQGYVDNSFSSVLGKAHIFSSLLPLVFSYIGPVAALDPRSAVQVLNLVQEILPPAAALNSQGLPASPKHRSLEPGASQENTTTSQHYAVVESDHPYKPATVANYKVSFPECVKWMSLEFDPQCGTAQAEDTLQIYIPCKRYRLPGQKDGAEKHKDLQDSVPVLKKFNGLTNWPCLALLLPGNEVSFSLETASDYVKDDKACFYGFKCSIVGYEWPVKPDEGIVQLEKAIAYLGGMCASSLMRKDIILPPVSLDEADEDMDFIEESSDQVFQAHPCLLSRGFALSHPLNISQALEGSLPFSWQSNERAFLKDFVACTPGTSGGRLARWLQPDSYLDPKQCDIVYSKEELRCSWPAVITVITKDQYGQVVMVPNLKVEVKAVPIEHKDSLDDEHKKLRRLSKQDDINSMTFGGHPPPRLDMPYDVTLKDKKDAFHAICMMKAYENYSFEELRFASPAVRRPSENMLVRANNDGTYCANWTPGSIGWYNLHVTIDGFETGDAYKVDVKEPPQGVVPPNQGASIKKPSHQPSKMRKFVAKYSAGLRVRQNPSLQSEQIGIIKPNGILGFTDEIHNDDGVWVRLSADSIRKWCTSGQSEAWCLQYNQHLGKTLLVPVEEPKSILDEIIKERILRRLPELIGDRRREKRGGPGLYQVVKCGSSGHNVRCRASMKATPIGMLVLGNQIMVVEDCVNSEGTWVKMDQDSRQRYCHETEGEAWSLARGPDDIEYLQHECELSSESDEAKFGFGSGDEARGFDFSNAAQQVPAFNGFGSDQHDNDKTPGSMDGSFTSGSSPFIFGHQAPGRSQSSLTFGDPQVKYDGKDVNQPVPGPSFGTPHHHGSPKMMNGHIPGHDKPGLKPGASKPKDQASPQLGSSPKIYTTAERADLPPELQGVSVKDLVKALGKVRQEKHLRQQAEKALERPDQMAPEYTPPVTPERKTLAQRLHPCELRGVSVKDIIKVIGESRANGNGATPPQTPPGTPKKTMSRSSSPRPIPGATKKDSLSSSPLHSLSPRRDPTLAPDSPRRAESGASAYSTPPQTPPILGSSPMGSPRFGSPTCLGGSSAEGPHLTESPLTGSPLRVPAGKTVAQVKPTIPAGPHDGVKGHFNIGMSPPKCDDTVRLSPKTGRKDRSRQLRSKRERAASPVSKDKTSSVSSSRSSSLQREPTKPPPDPIKEALSPTVAECLRAVFAAFLWHEGIVHDAMACASFLKFHPTLTKELGGREREKTNDMSSLERNREREERSRNRYSAEVTMEQRDQLAVSVDQVVNNRNINKNQFINKQTTNSPQRSLEVLSFLRDRHKSEGDGLNADKDLSDIDDFENEIESDLPPTMQHLVYFWEELVELTLKIINQNLILPSPAVGTRMKKNDKKDKEKKEEKKGKKKKDGKAPSGRGNLFGEAAAGADGVRGGDRESVCELCGGVYPYPVTYHMRQAHPGCGQHAGGQGYNSAGHFCGGWAGNCGDGGIGGSSWYLICNRCREKYLKDKRQAMKEKQKKTKKKSTPLKQPSIMVPLEPHLVMKNNAMFLLDLASAAGYMLPQENQRKPHIRMDNNLPCVSEDGVIDQSPFPPVPFLYLCHKGAQGADSAFAEEVIYSEEDGTLIRSVDSPERNGRPPFGTPDPKQRFSKSCTSPDYKPGIFVSHISPQEECTKKPPVKQQPKSAQVSPESDLEAPKRVVFQRSISELATGDQLSSSDCTGSRVVMRRRNNSGGIADGGMSLLKHPSAAMTKLIGSVDKGQCKGGDKSLQRPVMSFIMQRHDLEGLQIAMRQSLRKAACRVYAFQALNWLIRSTSQLTCLHDLLWFCVSSQMAPVIEHEEEDEEKKKKEKKDAEQVVEKKKKKKTRKEHEQEKDRVCEHPMSDISIAGEMANILEQAFHTFLQTVSDVMMYLPSGSSLQQMAVRCWYLKFRHSDHLFLHKSHVFSNISKILSKSDEENDEVISILDHTQASSKILSLRDLTPMVEIKASSRQAMISSLTDNSTETFWESGDEDRIKVKSLTITCNQQSHPMTIYVHIDNSRDLGNKVSNVSFSCGPNADELLKQQQVEVEARHIGWVRCELPETNTKVIKMELKGPDNTLRVRQVKVLGGFDGERMMIGGQPVMAVMQQKNCEAETLKVFRLLTSLVFGRLISNDGSEDKEREEQKELEGSDIACEGENDLKEHMVGILFSRSKLTHLQKQVCAHIVQAIRKETVRVRDEWNTSLTKKVPNGENIRGSDGYCFELLSMVLALSGSAVGRAYLAHHNDLLHDLLTLLHTATPRVQRQVTSLLRRVLPDVTPHRLASILSVPKLPPKDFSVITDSAKSSSSLYNFDLKRPGILDVFLACIAKALTVQMKVKNGAGKGVTSVTLEDCKVLHDKGDKRWWLQGKMSHKLAGSIVKLLKDMSSGKLSDAWASVTKGAIAEAIVALTKLEEAYRSPNDCITTPMLWLALASLCVLDNEHVERLSSGQWVNGQANQQRPTCDNHDDGDTVAIILCTLCGNLCADCDRFLHLHRRTRSHQRQVFKEEEEAIKVDLHEGCGRTKLFWVMALADSKTLKAMVEFREGTKGKISAGKPGNVVGTCRFCGATDSTGILAIGNICSDAECQEHAKNACSKTHPCGHPCGGFCNENPCLPCLHGCNKEGDGSLRQDADDMCMICFTEALSNAPAIKLICGHVFHYHCCRKVLERKWVGPRITFGFSKCPICKGDIEHPVLKDLLDPILALYEDVKRKSTMRLEYEGLHVAKPISTPGTRYFSDPSGFAMERYAYYVCYKCKKAYYGGEARCDEQAADSDEYDPTELVCGGCSDVSRAQMCPKHGTDFLEYKCRYCCSVAVFFCFGTTHFCNACHDDFQRVTNIPKSELPHCPAGPKGKQLEGDECPLHVQHPPTGEEFALGCGVCRNAHTF